MSQPSRSQTPVAEAQRPEAQHPGPSQGARRSARGRASSDASGLAWTPRQRHWVEVAREVGERVIRPGAEEVDRTGRFPRDHFAALAEAGLTALPVPEDRGGPGADFLTSVLVLEEIGRCCASTAMILNMHLGTVPLLANLARGEQVERFVRPVLEDGWLGTTPLSEPQSGSHNYHLQSHAVRREDGFLLDSFKSWATSAGKADFYLLPVRSSAEATPNQMSIFYVYGDDPTVESVGDWDGMGLRGNSSTPMRFRGTRVPASHLLGPEGFGFQAMMTFGLPIYQIGLSSIYVGIAQAARDAALEHVRGRVHADTGRALGELETVQRYLAEMDIALALARLKVNRVAKMADAVTKVFEELARADLLLDMADRLYDDFFLLEVCEVKVAACEMVQEVTHRALKLCGGTGYRRGHPVERHRRDAQAGSVMGPTDDELKVIIGRRALGMPYPWEAFAAPVERPGEAPLLGARPAPAPADDDPRG